MVDQLQSLAVLRRCRTSCETAIAVSGLGRVPIEFATCLLGIFSDIDQNRPRPSRLCQPESFAHRRGKVFGSRDEIVMLSDRQGNAGNVGLLKGVVTDQLAADLPRDAHDW